MISGTCSKDHSASGKARYAGPVVSVAAGALLLCQPSVATACFDVPKEARIPAETLIDKAGSIYLARVVSAVLVTPGDQKAPAAAGRPVAALNKAGAGIRVRAERGRPDAGRPGEERVDYRFSVVETVAGREREDLTLQFRFMKERFDAQFSDFDSHNDEMFWTHPRGRTQIRKDCSITPVFEVGHTYLVFPGAYHMNGYELILDPDDKWLRFVRERRQKAAQQE